MRPLKLTLQAFGPFLKKVTIPFENLDKTGLYLITGPTGSGKTTIFDAISFALFNQSSGSFRGTNSLRSHFADDKLESFVELVFEHKGEIYTVIRTPFYERKKTKGEGFITVNSKAQLTLPNSKLVLGVREVDLYIEKLLGINASQFGQIALLAQGEFLKILNSDTQKRGEIFRSIFKTKIFSNFSFCVKNKADILKAKYLELKQSFLQYVSQINSKNAKINDYIRNYTSNDCIYNVDEFILLFSGEIKKDHNKIEKFKNIVSRINNEIKNNDLIISKIKEKISLKNDIKNYENQTQSTKQNFMSIKKEYDELSKKRNLLDEVKIRIEKSNDLLKKINSLSDLKKELKLIKDSKSKLEIEIFEIKKDYLKSSYLFYFSLKDKLDKKKKEFLSLQTDCDLCNAEFNKLNNEFLSFQAGILASDLKDNIPCPVCGSVNHPNPAKLPDNVSYELVKNMKNKTDKMREALSQLSVECSLLSADVDLALSNFKKLESRFCMHDFICQIEKIVKFIKKDEFENIIALYEENLSKKINLLTEFSKKIAVAESSVEFFLKEFNGLNLDDAKRENSQLKLELKNLENEINCVEEKYFSSQEIINDLISKLAILNESYIKIDFCEDKYDEIKIKNEKLLLSLSNISEKLKICEFSYNLNKNIFERLKFVFSEFKNVDKQYTQYKILSDVANGTMNGKAKIAFEQYIQGYYLDLIIFEANKRLKVVTKNQFQLLRKKDSFSKQSKVGLDLEVMDFYTFKTRSTKTLSGGESFMTALCLALGLSDVISAFSGAVEINSIFIDEGFGTLDIESLELAWNVITSLSESGRTIGVISHVEDLKNRIENKIVVSKSDTGSSLQINF